MFFPGFGLGGAMLVSDCVSFERFWGVLNFSFIYFATSLFCFVKNCWVAFAYSDRS